MNSWIALTTGLKRLCENCQSGDQERGQARLPNPEVISTVVRIIENGSPEGDQRLTVIGVRPAILRS